MKPKLTLIPGGQSNDRGLLPSGTRAPTANELREGIEVVAKALRKAAITEGEKMMDFDTAVLDTSEHDCLDHTLGFEMGALFSMFTSKEKRLVVVVHEVNKGRALRMARRMEWTCTSWRLCGTKVARAVFTKGRKVVRW